MPTPCCCPRSPPPSSAALSIFGGRGSFAGAIVGALILRVLDTMLTLLQMPEGARTALFGLIILAVTALYVRITGTK